MRPWNTAAAAVHWWARAGITRRTLIVSLGAAALLPGALTEAAHAGKTKRLVINIRIKNGRVISPKGPVRVTQGDVVELHWTSNTRIRLHLHGYNRKLEVRPGETAKLVIRARVAGRFPIERHGGGNDDTLTYLEVYPR